MKHKDDVHDITKKCFLTFYLKWSSIWPQGHPPFSPRFDGSVRSVHVPMEKPEAWAWVLSTFQLREAGTNLSPSMFTLSLKTKIQMSPKIPLKETISFVSTIFQGLVEYTPWNQGKLLRKLMLGRCHFLLGLLGLCSGANMLVFGRVYVRCWHVFSSRTTLSSNHISLLHSRKMSRSTQP